MEPAAGRARRERAIADVRRRIDHLARLVRWRDWSTSKLPLYLACMAYATLRAGPPGLEGLIDIAGLVALLSLFASFGHMVNDYSDREIDRLVGKQRPFGDWGETSARATLVLLAILTIALSVPYGAVTMALTMAAIAAAAAYSLRPARLKERPALGWAAATLAQRTIPVAIVFQALGVWDVAAIALTLLGTLTGLRFIIVHQLFDRAMDRQAAVRTAATSWPPERLRTLFVYVLFPAEVVSATAATMAMGIQEPAVVVLSAAYPIGLWLAWRRGIVFSTVSYVILSELYCILWPVTLCGLLAWRDPVYLPVLAGAIALVANPVRARWSWAREKATGEARSAEARPVSDGERGVDEETGTRTTARPAAVNLRSAGRDPTPRPGAPPVPKADPYPAYARMRAAGPVHVRNVPGLGATTLIPRYRDVLLLLKDPRLIRDTRALEAVEGAAMIPAAGRRGFGRDMVEMDPPDHTRLRRLVGKAFTSRTVEQLAGRVERVTERLIEAARPRGEIELISELASSLPIRIITRLLGIPIADTEKFRRFVFALTVFPAEGPTQAALLQQKERFSGELRAIFAKRRQEPRDDLLTALVQAEQEGDRLSTEELVSLVYLLLIGGFLTTANFIGTGMLSLLRNPDQLDLLRRNPALIDGAAEELLRFESPLELTAAAYASTDIELEGGVIWRGAAVRLILPSANRDETKFENPDSLDITRTPCPHLAFGQGIHFCLGAPLARLEGKVALRLLIERLANLRLADPARVEWLPHPVLRGLRRLPLRFDA